MNIAEKIIEFREDFSFKKLDGKVVFTNGCFDLLHYGHVKLLENCKNEGDFLVVGLNSDASIRELKGSTRPIIAEYERAYLLASLLFVDFVVIYNEPTPIEIIKKLIPDVLIKGGDYKVEDVVGYDYLKSKGKEVKIFPILEGFSTTTRIKNIIQKNHEGH